jgi:hypothetical protein
MKLEKTRLFIANPLLHTRREDDLPQPSAPAAPLLGVRGAEEPTRFLAVERLLDHHRGAAQPRPQASESEPSRAQGAQSVRAHSDEPTSHADLGDTDLCQPFLALTWTGRARSAWRSLSIASRLSIALLPVAAVSLTLAPQVSLDAQDAGRSAPAALPKRPRSAAAATAESGMPAASALHVEPDADAPTTPAARTQPTPRAVADAVAQGRCAEAVTLYRDLFRRYPEVTAYREAARILKEQHIGCTESE